MRLALRFGPLVLSSLDYCTHDNVTRSGFAERATHYPEIFDRTVRHEQPVFEVKFLALLGSAFDELPELRPVVRVGALEHPLHGRCGRGIVFKDAIEFFGPVDLSAGYIPMWRFRRNWKMVSRG